MDLEMQLRAAEARRADLERQHQEALTVLAGCGPDMLETRQSRVRELEKKIALENVRCEELQLELASNSRTRQGLSYVPTPVHQPQWTQSKGTEIEKIMAKIEQDNRILAELDHSRSTTLGQGLATSMSSHALGECSPPISPITMSHTTPSIYPNSTSLGGQHSYNAGTSYVPNPASVGGFNAATTYNSLGYNKPLIGSGLGHTMMQPSVLGALMPSITSTNYSTNTTFSNPLVSTNPGRLGQVPSYNNPITSTLNQFSTLGQFSNPLPIVTTSFSNAVTFSNPLSSQFNSLATPMNIKLKMDEVDLGQRRVATPVTPHPPPWTGGGIPDLRPRMLTDGLDADWSAVPTGVPSSGGFLNGQQGQDGQVDMLDIPGKGRCSVYIARFSYEPEPESEEELTIVAGDYLLVWGEPMGPGGYLDAELLDGRRGLVPAHFVQRLIGDDLLEFHQAVLSTLREEEINQENFAADVARLNELAEMAEQHEDDNSGPEVPAPRQLTLERQLNKSVLISWTAPDNVGPNQIESYHVYVDGVLKATIKATERTRALVEGVDSNRPHRISVRSVTANRRTSRDAACTMIIGRDTHQLGPSAVRASNITSTSAVISWLPANSNHQHVVCVNNVEVRTVKPGVYRHTITGLAPNTQYRVTVRAKHHRSAQNVANLAEELPMPAAAHTDFRTLPKGLPDPPSDILVEPGPQDGTLLVTWHPILNPHHQGSTITGYAVFADGKKVTDVDSPTGDHALIDISKLLGLNPRHVTVRSKARDGQSADSVPTPIPNSVLRGGPVRRQQPHSAVMPAHMRQRGQQIIEPDENLSDKEIFPNQHHRQQGIPSIEITKENYEGTLSEDEMDRNRRFTRNQQQRQNAQAPNPGASHYAQQQVVTNQRQNQMRSQPMRPSPNQPKKTRDHSNTIPKFFVALFDYDPSTMSPNPDACDEELPFSEGDTIKVWGEKDADGFYWGECRGRKGYVPHNMVMELDSNHSNQVIQQQQQQHGNQQMNVRRMVALYDYDPQELSPNVDAEVELSFQTGQIITVFGEMDEDGFYNAEIEGVRGLVPSNFLADANDQFGGQQNPDMYSGRQPQGPVRGTGPGARGPPPPPRDNQMRNANVTGQNRGKDACHLLYSSSQLDSSFNNTQASMSNTNNTSTEHQQGRLRGMLRQGPGNQQMNQTQPNPPQQQTTMGSLFSSLTGSNQQQQNNQQTYGQTNQQTYQSQQNRLQHKGIPQVIPNVSGMAPNAQPQPGQPGGPNLMQKLNEITAPGGDILSKGKELIFMKFGLGGK